MKNSIFSFMAMAVLAAGTFAKTINVPTQSLEQAVAMAKRYADAEKIDVSRYFLAAAEYRNLHNEYETPYWRIEWRMLAGANTGQIVVVVNPDGTAYMESNAANDCRHD